MFIKNCFVYNHVKLVECIHFVPCFHFTGYIKRFRYCEYIGKFFCQCCHSNSMSYIPGRIIQRWDFKKYYVSNFARDFIVKIFNEPLFHLNDINSSLYKKVKPLEIICDLRLQLGHLKNFTRICKYAAE